MYCTYSDPCSTYAFSVVYDYRCVSGRTCAVGYGLPLCTAYDNFKFLLYKTGISTYRKDVRLVDSIRCVGYKSH